MTLQELVQGAQRLIWQEQFHLATWLLQWANERNFSLIIAATTDKPNYPPEIAVVG
jgi:hypothetical protein